MSVAEDDLLLLPSANDPRPPLYEFTRDRDTPTPSINTYDVATTIKSFVGMYAPTPVTLWQGRSQPYDWLVERILSSQYVTVVLSAVSALADDRLSVHRTPLYGDVEGTVRTRVAERKREVEDASSNDAENPVVRAVNEISRWLRISRVQALQVAGLKERTFYYWQSRPNTQPRLASVDQLSRIHALLEGLVRDFGTDWTRQWIRDGSPSRLSRMLTDTNAVTDIEAEALSEMRDHWATVIPELGVTSRRPSEGDPAAFAAAEVKLADPLQPHLEPTEGGEGQ